MIESCDVKLYLESDDDDQLEPLLDPMKRVEMSHLADTHLVSVLFLRWGDQQVKEYST